MTPAKLYRTRSLGFLLLLDDTGENVPLKEWATMPGARQEAADLGYGLGTQWVDSDGSLKTYMTPAPEPRSGKTKR